MGSITLIEHIFNSSARRKILKILAILAAILFCFFPVKDRLLDRQSGPELESFSKERTSLPSLEVMLGQSFVVGIPGDTLDEETKEMLRTIKPAGIVLYYRNYTTQDQFKNLISDLQKFAQATTGQDYLIMIDEEPGGATRLDLFQGVFQSGMPDWDRIEHDIKTMASLGINVDLAPLADFPFDENTFIEARIPAHSVEALIDFNREFISMLQKNNVSATLKHFPGMGVFVTDPHKKISITDTQEEVIDKSLQIFKDGINANPDFVMTSHGVYDALDENVPVTLSKKITTDILRTELGFRGLIITDDLSDMPFIPNKDIGMVEALVKSLKAGHNLLTFSHQSEKTVSVFKDLLDRAQDDSDLKLIIEDNYRLVVVFKQRRFGKSISLVK